MCLGLPILGSIAKALDQAVRSGKSRGNRKATGKGIGMGHQRVRFGGRFHHSTRYTLP
jgi:hypothetical protein